MLNSPWGRAQTQHTITPGIVQVTTASHGGIHLIAALNAQVHEVWRCKGGWYEEDGDWAIVALTFPQHFSDEALDHANTTGRDFYPDGYEAVFGVKLTAADSHTRREEEFRAANADRWVVVAAWGEGAAGGTGRVVPAGMVGTVALKGGRGGTGDRTEGHFLVPDDEYSDRGPFGFVIDEERHQAWPKPGPDPDGLTLAYPGQPTVPYTMVVDGRKVPSTWRVYAVSGGQLGELWRNRHGQWTAYARSGGTRLDGMNKPTREEAAAAVGWRLVRG